jgi:hypothetical protein
LLTPPAQPAVSLFLLSTRGWQVGPGRQDLLPPPAAGGRPPSSSRRPFRPGPPLPRHQTAPIKCSDASSLHSPF